jgi:hypothetical protein
MQRNNYMLTLVNDGCHFFTFYTTSKKQDFVTLIYYSGGGPGSLFKVLISRYGQSQAIYRDFNNFFVESFFKN